MKLGLGTVQFGLNYGISNSIGQTPEFEVKSILKIAQEKGIQNLDTAALYGNSEEVLGNSLKQNHSFQIITKTNKADIKKGFEDSLKKLKAKAIYGLLFHDCKDLNESTYQTITEFKQKGLVKKIGVSVYNQAEIEFSLKNFQIDLVQLPINIFDQRLLQTKTLDKIKNQNIEIHARSAFLQGLAFIEPEKLESQFHDLKPKAESLRRINLPIPAICLAFLKSLSQVDSIICGVNTSEQLQELVSAYNSQLPKIDFSEFAISNERILNPALWNKKDERKCDNHSSL